MDDNLTAAVSLHPRTAAFGVLTHTPFRIYRCPPPPPSILPSHPFLPLREIPPEFGKLRNLKELLLFHNKLHSIPFEIGSLFQLYTLGLHGNPLDQPLATYMSDGTFWLTCSSR
jgi:CCR4-NOT transcription complex subunit 6